MSGDGISLELLPDDTQPIPVIRGRHAAPRGSRPWVRRSLGVLREVGIVAAVVAVLLVAVRLVVGQLVYVADDAMEPTLAPGDRVLVSSWGDPRAGDIVLVQAPSVWGTPDGNAIVRVVATSGQRVACCDDGGRITVDGTAIRDYGPGPSDQVEFDIVVPAGRVFTLADQRSAARDSRVALDAEQGTLPLDAVRGRVVAVLWPLGE